MEFQAYCETCTASFESDNESECWEWVDFHQLCNENHQGSVE